MIDVTNNKSFGSILTDISHIAYAVYEQFTSLYS